MEAGVDGGRGWRQGKMRLDDRAGGIRLGTGRAGRKTEDE
jgi:hypothetical protein